MKRPFSIAQVAKATGGKILSQKLDQVQGIGTDTRKDLSGELFIALKGPSFDAGVFLDQAIAKGAACLLTERAPSREILEKVSVIQVDDTLKALQDFGRWVRRASKAQILGITGSNGKTTTKEFCAQLISPYRKLHYNKGSFNNHWGVPLTLLEMPEDAEVVVCEMGMNHAGEIKELVGIAEPDVVTVTTVGRAHLEAFSSMDELAQAKEEIYTAAPEAAVGIFNLDNPHTLAMLSHWKKSRPHAKALSFSKDKSSAADVSYQVSELRVDSMVLEGRIGDKLFNDVSVSVFGEQNVSNLMAATSLALAAGVRPHEIIEALPLCRTSWGRNQTVSLQSGARVIFDGYNANPDSMAALLSNLPLLQAAPKKYAVLGEMLEMGEGSADLHEELGYLAGSSDLDWIWFVGSQGAAFQRGLKRANFSKNSVISVSYEESIASELRSMLEAEEVIIVKGSRGIGLEKVVMALEPLDFTAKA